MKKFMKGCAIAALIFLALGIGLAVAAGTVRGRATITKVVETVTGGRVSLNFDSLFSWGMQVRDDLTDSLPELDYDIDDATSFNNSYEEYTGDVEKTCLGSSVENLKIEAGGCLFNVQFSGDDSFYVEASDCGKFQAYLENGTLYIRTTTSSRSWGWKGSQVKLYVPEGCHFKKADIDLGAGEMEFGALDAERIMLGVGAGRIVVDDLRAEALEMEIGAGQIEIKEIMVKSLEAEADAGELLVSGSVEGDVDVSCAVGNVELNLAGSQQDFNYRLEGAMGNIDLGSESYSGFGMSKQFDNGAEKNIKVECSAGNITIRFTN